MSTIGKGTRPFKACCLGMTAIELMVTLAIVGILSTAGYFTLAGVLPRRRLENSTKMIHQMVVRAQSEAFSRAQRVGVQFTDIGSGQTTVEVYVDDGVTSYQRDSDEAALTSVSLQRDISMVDNVCNSMQLSGTCDSNACNSLFFNASGEAENTAGNSSNFEIFVENSKMVGRGVREVEVFSNGGAQMVRLGQAGDVSGGFAANSTCPP